MQTRIPALAPGLVLLALAGCEPPPRIATPAPPQPYLRDTQTIHDAGATKIWIIHGTGADERVILCDVDMLKQTKTALCVQWP